MARKTFISYKYSDARCVRDRIIDALGDDAKFYRGEDGFSDDLTGLKADTIKNRLKDMIYGTSVTIVVISPEMKLSKWIPWELEYSLKDVKRGDRYSHSNGIVGVIKKVNGDYSWIRQSSTALDGCSISHFDESRLPEIIKLNRANQTPKEYLCSHCKTIDRLTGSYISLINEDEFLRSPDHFIENAFCKSNHLENYCIHKTAR